MDWSSFISGLAGKAVDVYAADRQADRSYQVGQLQLQQQATAAATAAAQAQASTISPTVLMIGAAVLVVGLVLANK